MTVLVTAGNGENIAGAIAADAAFHPRPIALPMAPAGRVRNNAVERAPDRPVGAIAGDALRAGIPQHDVAGTIAGDEPIGRAGKQRTPDILLAETEIAARLRGAARPFEICRCAERRFEIRLAVVQILDGTEELGMYLLPGHAGIDEAEREAAHEGARPAHIEVGIGQRRILGQ